MDMEAVYRNRGTERILLDYDPITDTYTKCSYLTNMFELSDSPHIPLDQVFYGSYEVDPDAEVILIR